MKKIILILSVLVLTFVFTGTVSAAENWDVTGDWKFNYEHLSSYYEHSALLTQTDSTVNGDGGYPAGGPYQYHWNITYGNVTGNQVHLEMTYDLGVPVCDMTMDGDIALDGTLINGTWSDDCWGISRNGTWTSSVGNAAFNRRAAITAPNVNENVWGDVTFEAYLVDNDVDSVQWAVREGTCAAGIGTVFGNVDGHSDVATMDTSDLTMQMFSFTGDMSAMTPGMYCFIYNPVEDSGETNLRETREFAVRAPYKSEILIGSGVPGKGLDNAPGLQKPFNPKSQAVEHAGKKK